MEDLLERLLYERALVSILVVMDQLFSPTQRAERCVLQLVARVRFNPCCHGSALQPGCAGVIPQPLQARVSILVVMDQLFSRQRLSHRRC